MRQTNSPQPVATASAPRAAVRPRWEWPVVIGMLLMAAAFRLLALNDVPPGLHHDEVIIGQIAKDILRGQLAIYFMAGYGHEPLYHYLLAGMFAAIGATDFALRLTSAFVSIVGLAVAYRFTRRLFAPAVAIGALGWMAVSLWPIFFARVGLRGITLPLMASLTAYWLWRALRLPSSNQPFAFIPSLRSGQALHPSSLILHPSRHFPRPYPLHLPGQPRLPDHLPALHVLRFILPSRSLQPRLARTNRFICRRRHHHRAARFLSHADQPCRRATHRRVERPAGQTRDRRCERSRSIHAQYAGNVHRTG